MDWRRIVRARFSSQVNRAALAEAMSAVVADRDRWRDARPELRIEAVTQFSAEICLQRHAAVLTRATASQSIT